MKKQKKQASSIIVSNFCRPKYWPITVINTVQLLLHNNITPAISPSHAK